MYIKYFIITTLHCCWNTHLAEGNSFALGNAPVLLDYRVPQLVQQLKGQRMRCDKKERETEIRFVSDSDQICCVIQPKLSRRPFTPAGEERWIHASAAGGEHLTSTCRCVAESVFFVEKYERRDWREVITV